MAPTKKLTAAPESPFKGYEYKGGKGGGAKKDFGDGGRYKKDGATYLLKYDGVTPENDIAEYLSSCIFGVTAPGSGAEITLIKPDDAAKHQDTNGNPYLASKFFGGGEGERYRDLTKDRSPGLEIVQALVPGTYGTERKLENLRYDNYSQIIVTSLLLGDFSLHSGNIGVVAKGDKRKLVRLDFGAAMRPGIFEETINPFQSIMTTGSTVANVEKNYFLRDHPTERIITPQFMDELREVAETDLTGIINTAWGQITEKYNPKTIQKFAENIGVPEGDRGNNNKIKKHFANRMEARKQSLRNMATEIDLQLAIKSKDDGKIRKAFADAAYKNLAWCKTILQEPEKAQLHPRVKMSKAHIEMLGVAVAVAENSRRETVPADQVIYSTQHSFQTTRAVDTHTSQTASKPFSGSSTAAPVPHRQVAGTDLDKHLFYEKVQKDPRFCIQALHEHIKTITDIYTAAQNLRDVASPLTSAEAMFQLKNGRWEINPDSNFTGPIFMPRVDGYNEQVLDNNKKPVFDILHYENGELKPEKSFIAPDGIPKPGVTNSVSESVMKQMNEHANPLDLESYGTVSRRSGSLPKRPAVAVAVAAAAVAVARGALTLAADSRKRKRVYSTSASSIRG